MFIAVTLITVVSARAGKPALWNYMAETRINWHPYTQKVFAMARSKDQPLFVLIYADWCDWCKKYEQETVETRLVRKRLHDTYLPVAINYESEKALSARLGARLVPTTILLTPDGKKLARFFGFMNPEDLAETLDQTLALWR